MKTSLALLATLWITGVGFAVAAPKDGPSGRVVPLFNGKDLRGWKGQLAKPLNNPALRARADKAELAAAQTEANANMREHWKVEEGVLAFDGRGRNLCTAKDYGDFELSLEWKIPPKGESGIFLRGTPQVQIWDKRYSGSGGLFNNKSGSNRPLKRADRPPGEWNRFTIRMVGDTVSVWLNGELVADEVVMENYWERDKPIYPKGPIELQAHGTRLWFRNIYIRELAPK